jgi:uncharacterized protein (TIGR03085 family)
MVLPFDARERVALCALLSEVGPDAPTLCGDWTTFDLAVHLVVRERNPLAAPGIVVGGPFESLTNWAMAHERRRGFDAVVERVRGGPPFLPWRLPFIREVLNLNEYFVHHEDVRRANGEGPRSPQPDLDRALEAAVRRVAPLILRPAGVEAELVTDAGSTVASRGVRPAKVVGRPGELLLWLNGRSDVANVRFDGTDAQLEVLWKADLGT